MNRSIIFSLAAVSAFSAGASIAQEDAQNQQTTSQTATTNAMPSDTDSSNASSRASNDASNTANASSSSRVAEASSGQSKAGGSVVAPVVMVLLPVEMQSQSNANANGCWARLYGEHDLKGDTLTLVGPVDMANMTGPFGIDWGNKVHSIEAGPKANITIYDNQNFADRAATIRPNQKVRELDSKLGFFEDVNSMRISCNKGSG